MIRQFVAAWVALLALVSFSYAKETSVVSFDFYAEFEGFAEDDIPSLPVTFTHPSGTTPINYEDWDNYDWPLRRATKTAQEKVTEGQPIYFSCNFDHEQLDEEFGTNPTQVCEVTVVPPPWANKVIVYETYDTEGGPFISTWIRGEGNRWASAEHYMPSYENYPGYSYSTLPYVVMRVQAWDRDSVYGWFKFEGGGCSSCTTCANHNSGYSPPSISTGSGDSPGFSGSLPFSSECCEDDFEPTSISWQPTTLAGAAQKASISVNSVKLVNGTPNVRYPVDPTEPLQQLKVNSTLGVLATTSSELTWKVYDATDIGAPNFSGEYPLTKTNSDPLPLMEEIKITQESTTSVLYEYKKGGALVSKHRLTYNSTEGSWLNENILAESREKLTIEEAEDGWLRTAESYIKNASATWQLVASSASETATVGDLEVVVKEYEGGDLVSEHGYYETGLKKWTSNADGSWKFYEYSGSETRVYGPYGDTAFPGSTWTPPTPLTSGFRCDITSGTSTTSKVGNTAIHSYSTSTSIEEDYVVETTSTSDGVTRTSISVDQAGFVFKLFRGKMLSDDDGRGVTTLHQYSRGTWSEGEFEEDSAGGYVMEIITKAEHPEEVPDLQPYDEGEPTTIGAVFDEVSTRDVRVFDPKGRTVYSALQVLDGAGYGVATETTLGYAEIEEDGEVVTETKDGRIVSVSSSLADGTWEENIDEAGLVSTTIRDLLGRVLTETSSGPNGGNIVRSYARDALATTTTTSGGGLSLTTSETRDLRGRATSSTDETGAVTEYEYNEANRETTTTRPGGVEEVMINYRDGRYKERSGSGVIRQFASYGIDETSGNEITTRSSGPAVTGDHGSRWVQTTTDHQGRTVTVRRPGPPIPAGGRQDDVVETYSYDGSSGRLASVKSDAEDFYRVYEADSLGMWSASGIALDDNALEPESDDRYSSTAVTYEKRSDGKFWQVSTQSTYVQGSTPVVTSSAVRLWTGDGEISESTDAAANTIQRTTIFNSTTNTVVSTTVDPNQGTTVETTTGGFLRSRDVPEAANDELYFYNGLGREIQLTDVRNASTRTIYNGVDQVEKVVDHLGQSVSYAYYGPTHQSAGRVHTQTDAGGIVTETTYDALGRVTSVGGSASYPVSYTYNAVGDRETLTTNGTETAVTTWTTDHPTGLLLEKKYDGESNGVKYSYFGNGRLKSRTWRRGVETDYGYTDDFEDLETITYVAPDNTPDVSFSEFDRLGRPGTVTEGGNTTTLTYDAVTGEASTAYAEGHGILPDLSVIKKAPDAGRPGGYELKQDGANLQSVFCGYDSFGRLDEITSGGDEVTYQYYSGTGIVRETSHSVSGIGTPRIETRAVDLAGQTVGVVTTVPGTTGRKIAASAGYLLNERGLRQKLTREDGTSWNYGYNDRSEVTSGLKKLANGSLAAGLQFGYHYDGIGNREWAKSGGDSGGDNQRTVNYTPNALNQYAEIETPSTFDVLVRSPDAVGVSVNSSSVSVTNQGNLYRAEGSVTNTAGAWAELEITSPLGDPVTGHRWLPPASFNPSYDDDGNLTNDGRWICTWDAENRLISQTTSTLAAAAGVARCKVENTYDWRSRRIQKRVSSSTDGTIWTLNNDERFVYDGWNLLAIFDASGSTLTVKETDLWGLDLSGNLQGVGGVGGLLAVNNVSTSSTCYPAYDGNGNIIAWTETDGNVLQRIDYDPFGNVVTREGDSDFHAPAWGFSTRYQDVETGLYYYGHRYYDPVTGRWPSRDPIEESGGINLNYMVGNNPVNNVDFLGLSELSEAQYTAEANRLIDAGVHDPDLIFQGLAKTYLKADPESDVFWDCQDDFEEIFDALGNVFGDQPTAAHKSPNETQADLRWRKVQSWVSSTEYRYDATGKPTKNPKTGLVIWNAKTPTNPTRKFEARMDHVSHMFATAGVSANMGENFADGIAGPGHETSDGLYYIWEDGDQEFFNRDNGFSSLDIEWNLRGSELQNAFDASECDCRKLAKKFANGTFTISNWKAWYRQPWSVIYK